MWRFWKTKILLTPASIFIAGAFNCYGDELMLSKINFLKEKSASMQQALMHEQYVSAATNFAYGTIVLAVRSFIPPEDTTANRNIYLGAGLGLYAWSAWQVYDASSTSWVSSWQRGLTTWEQTGNDEEQKVKALHELEDLWRGPAHTKTIMRTIFGSLLGAYGAYLIYFGISEKFAWYQITLDSTLFAGLAAYNLFVPGPVEEQWQEYYEIYYGSGERSAKTNFWSKTQLALNWIPYNSTGAFSPALALKIALF